MILELETKGGFAGNARYQPLVAGDKGWQLPQHFNNMLEEARKGAIQEPRREEHRTEGMRYRLRIRYDDGFERTIEFTPTSGSNGTDPWLEMMEAIREHSTPA